MEEKSSFSMGGIHVIRRLWVRIRTFSFIPIYVMITTPQLRTTVNVPYAFFGVIVCLIHLVVQPRVSLAFEFKNERTNALKRAVALELY